jgi:predicted dehydrogenase
VAALKIGVIGAGAIAPSHCKGIQTYQGAELVAIADAHEGRARALQDEYRIPRRYDSIERMIADRDLDAVTIALPNYLHAPTAVAALGAGKHVMSDKPFTVSVADGEAVIAAAARAGKVFAVGMNQRFRQESQVIRTIVERGDLGSVYFAKAFWCRRTGIPRLGTWFGDKKRSGGGSLLDIGVHMLDLCLWLLGNFDAEAVSGVTYTKFGNRGLGEGGWGKSDREKIAFDVDDLASALIRLKGGVTVMLETSWARHQELPSANDVELFGTDGGARLFPARVFRSGERAGEYEVVEPQGVPIRYAHCERVHNWIDAILGKAELECRPGQALAVQKILDAIYRSAASGREVRIE